ncbi:MAG TPA: TIM barrel protein [Bryobacteraceae bacterium]|jgi:hydroxypyruvate isomerase|nr:TIM barrel protein [Bryobacteraceae bacterium]
MQRRHLLKTGAALLAGAAIARPQASAPPKAKITSSVMLWTLKGAIEEKLETAARAGLQSVELIDEYAHWSDADIARVKKIARSFGLGIDTLLSSPDWVKRPVSMVDPAHREAFLADVRNAIGFAQKLEIPQLILMSGNAIPGRTHEEQYASLLEGAKRAGDLAAEAKLTMIVEPLNSLINHKGFFLTTCTEGLKLIREVDNPHVRLLFDLYHEQVQQGNVIRTLTEAAPDVAVFHVADNPGRNDPGTGEMNYPNIYKAIQKTGYGGYLTMEYLPLGEQVASLTKAVDGFRLALAG